MPEYLHYDRLSDWDDDKVVLVEVVDSETGDVRTFFPNRRSGDQPLKDAFEEAHRILAQDVHIERIGVWLRDGVEWQDSWGTLIKP